MRYSLISGLFRRCLSEEVWDRILGNFPVTQWIITLQCNFYNKKKAASCLAYGSSCFGIPVGEEEWVERDLGEQSRPLPPRAGRHQDTETNRATAAVNTIYRTAACSVSHMTLYFDSILFLDQTGLFLTKLLCKCIQVQWRYTKSCCIFMLNYLPVKALGVLKMILNPADYWKLFIKFVIFPQKLHTQSTQYCTVYTPLY